VGSDLEKVLLQECSHRALLLSFLFAAALWAAVFTSC
jgi:hypothetical protein